MSRLGGLGSLAIGGGGRGGRGGGGGIVDAFQQFQQAQTISPAQNEAIKEQNRLRDTINETFRTLGTGARNELFSQFATEGQSIGADFQSRGLAGSSLSGVAQIDLEAERQTAVGGLEAQLRQAQGSALQGIAGNISGILTGGADRSNALASSLLGAVDTTVTQPNTALPTVSGGGGGKGGKGGGGQKGPSNLDKSKEAKKKCIGLPVQSFVRCMRQADKVFFG